MNGTVKNDTTFVIEELKEYRTKETKKVNFIYKFRKTQAKPVLPNFFKSKYFDN